MTIHNFYDIISDPDNAALLTDCDCACAASHITVESDISPPRELQQHPLQCDIVLDDQYRVVFVPSVSRVAVMNNAAFDLLTRFTEPVALHTLQPTEYTAALQLYRLHLLLPPGSAVPPPTATELIAWLHVTNACNLRCSYCYIHKTDDEMDTATAYGAVDALFRTAQLHGYQHVALKYAGGEASLNLERVAEIHHYAQQHATRAGITLRSVILSNGVALRQAELERIRDLSLDLMISLDGPEAVHDQQRPRRGGQGSFVAVKASILRAKALGVPLTVSVTVTGKSVAALPTLLTWLLQHHIHFTLNFYRECNASNGVDELRLDEARMIAGMRTAYQTISANLPRYSLLGCLLDRTHLGAVHRHTCAAGENYLVINHNGTVAKCQMTIDQPVTTIWEHDPLITIQHDTTSVQNLPVEQKHGCRDCQWKYWCAGGCAVATFRATGRYDVQSPNCTIYQALYPDVLRLEGLRLLHWHRSG